MKHGSLFSGIGGFDLAAQWMGWENVFHCEWEEFPRKVLQHYWKDAISYGDIKQTDFTIHRGQIDILTGGFPCQPYSVAGKRLGKEDERHLFPEMLRAIREIKPTFIVGENVRGLLNWNGGLVFDEIHTDLEAEGYEVVPLLLPACGVNAPHKRDRIWFVAKNTNKNGRRSEQRKEESGKWKFRNFGSRDNERIRTNDEEIGFTINSNDEGRSNGFGEVSEWDNNAEFTNSSVVKPSYWKRFPTQSTICNGDDGLSSRLDGITFPKWRRESIKAGGNAIVPQVAYEIFKAIDKTINK